MDTSHRSDPEFFSNPDLEEVVEVFRTLFAVSDPEVLPASALVTKRPTQFGYRFARDNTPDWELDPATTPAEELRTYDEVLGVERSELRFSLPQVARSAVADPFDGPVAFNELLTRLHPDMKEFASWIMGDFAFIAIKRLAWSKRPSRYEDLLAIYRAGFFPYGWTGEYPDAVRYLAFAVRGETEKMAKKMGQGSSS